MVYCNTCNGECLHRFAGLPLDDWTDSAITRLMQRQPGDAAKCAPLQRSGELDEVRAGYHQHLYRTGRYGDDGDLEAVPGVPVNSEVNTPLRPSQVISQGYTG